MIERAATLLLLNWLLALFSVCSAADEPTIREKLGLEDVRCPLKHANIRAIPILYGLIEPSDELIEKLNRKELRLGGCSIDMYSPAYNGLCESCGLEYDPWLQTWSKTGTTTTTFSPPIDDLLKSFPLPKGAIPRFHQSFRGDKLSAQSMSFDHEDQSTAALGQLLAITEQWLRDKKIETTENHDLFELYKGIRRGYFWENAKVSNYIIIENSSLHPGRLKWSMTLNEKNSDEIHNWLNDNTGTPNYLTPTP